MTCFDASVLRDLTQSLQLEWLETDGLGGFAAGTVVGANVRRYHGLLVSATSPPVGRRVLVAGTDDRVLVNGDVHQFGCHVYGDAVAPQGHLEQVEFRLDPWPVFVWESRGVRLRKSVFMPHGLGTTVVRYDLLNAPHPAWLHVRPLLAGRDMHHLMRSNHEWHAPVGGCENHLALQPYDPPSAMNLHFPHGEFRPGGVWYYNFRYLRDEERGQDFAEDLYSPGELLWLLRPGETAWLVLAGREPSYTDPYHLESVMEAERARRERLLAGFGEDPVAGRLNLAADQFIVNRTVSGVAARTIIAGYPWFGDWGRDTMIALFGLTLTTRREADCRAMLRTFASQMQGGLVPNLFSEQSGEALYNTVDATLWFFLALRQYVRQSGDWEFISEVWPALQEALAAHEQGTAHGIHMTEDGLLSAGDASTQLTWMDAKVDDWVVTPRHGKAVEINALWYNALRTGEYFARKLGDEDAARRYAKLARKTHAGFEQFWCEERGWCHDALRPEGPDASLRPNQLIACAVPYSVLSAERRRRVLSAVSEHLLTPYGLRTLAPFEPGYCAHYGGDRWARDGAYHQGTVWPWLLGPYLDTYFGVMGVNETTRAQVRTLLQPLVAHLDEAGLGSVSEIFDAEEPFAPHGCFAQAWSVGELLRCWVQYGLGEA